MRLYLCGKTLLSRPEEIGLAKKCTCGSHGNRSSAPGHGGGGGVHWWWVGIENGEPWTGGLQNDRPCPIVVSYLITFIGLLSLPQADQSALFDFFKFDAEINT
jgi:hypothetical protein